MEQHIDLYLPFRFFNGFANDEGTDCLKDQPVGQNDPDGEFIAEERDEKLSQENDLSDDAAQPHNEQGGFEG